VCKLKDISPRVKIFPTTFVFRCKEAPDGSIEYKSRLCARGDLQTGPDVDEDSFYSPTGSHDGVRMLLSIAGKFGLPTRHLDCPNAFTLAPIEYKSGDDPFVIYPPPNRPQYDSDGDRIVYICCRQLYGFKGAPRAFHDFLIKVLKAAGFSQSTVEPCLLYKRLADGGFVWTFVYVDDLLLVASSTKALNSELNELHKRIKLKDLGEVKRYLGVDISRNPDRSFTLSQRRALVEILELAGMENCKPVTTPLEVGVLDSKEQAALREDRATLYRSLVGKLMYIATNTRPDILVATATLSKYLRDPQDRHWSSLKHLLAYIRGSLDTALILGRHKYNRLTIFSDADWGRDQERKSRSGSTGFLYGLISWSTQLDAVSLSTAESELYGLVHASQDAISLQYMINDLRTTFSNLPSLPPRVVGDNQASLQMAVHNTQSHQLRHVDIRYRFLHEKHTEGKLEFMYTPTSTNCADIMTKILPRDAHARNRKSIMMS